MRIIIILFFMSNAFAQWYAKGKGYEKCMNTADGFLVCREDYVNDFCYGKERTWSNHVRERMWYDRDVEKAWFDRKLIAVRNLNSKCEYHGWSKFKLINDTWVWQCYLNNSEREDSACKGFTKR